MKNLFLFILLLSIFTSIRAQSGSYYSKNGVAIKGYDVVAYFTDNAATEGSKQYSITWRDTEWHFKSQAHLDAFKANPEKYAPQFDGYCAYGVCMNHKAPTDPTAFVILGGKLYLNSSAGAQNKWTKDSANVIKSENTWKGLYSK